MTSDRDFKKKVRTRMAETGENYAKARASIEGSTSGWTLAGSHPGDYMIGVEASGPNGDRCAFLRCTKQRALGFGTLMQSIAAEDYVGKRIRLEAKVEPNRVVGWAGLWMRVDGPIAGRSLAFDNMQGRPIKGSGPWQEHQVVLDVPDTATVVAFGILLSGTGAVRISNVSFETVGPEVPPTGQSTPRQPVNLDFQESA